MERIDLAYFEQMAAAQVRSLELEPIRWQELLAAGQWGMAAAQADDFAGQSEQILVPTARIFDSVSRESTNLEPSARRGTALLACMAYGMYGNVPSAVAMARRAIALGPPFSPFEAAAVATVCPSLIGGFLNTIAPGPMREYIERLNYFLDTGDQESFAVSTERLSALFSMEPQPLESVLLGCAARALPIVGTLAIAAALPLHSSTLLHNYVQRVLAEGIRTFLPPQYAALHEANLIGGQNAVVALPTSTGKTLLGELATISSLEAEPGLSCYVAPYVALGQQVARVLRRRAPKSLRIHALIGGYRLPEPLDPTTQRELVVATPERFDALLRSDPAIARQLRCVVFDEAHLVGNGERGLRLEGLVTRLRLMQEGGLRFRIVMLSAVLSNPTDLVEWLGPNRTQLTVQSWRPTARRTVFWSSDGQLLMLVGDDLVRRPGQTAEATIGRRALPWPRPNLYPSRHFGQQAAQQGDVFQNVAYLVDYLLGRGEGSVLCVCSSKAETRGLAMAIAERLGPIDVMSPSLQRIVDRVSSRRPFLRSLAEVVRSGVAYHNAGVPGDVRDLIEAAVVSGQLRVVTATTTLAEGVDLPFRFTVLVDWLVWSDAGEKPMDPLLFRNIAGRSGRAGVHTDGDTFVFDNVAGAYEFTNSQVRRSYQRSVFATDTLPPLRSVTAQDEWSSLANNRAALASQFLGAIPENAGRDNLAQLFTQSSLAQVRGDATPLRHELDEIEASILDPDRRALAVAASPLQLTPFGESANLTGLSPESCRRLVAVIPSAAKVSDDIASMAAYLIRNLVDLAEQTNRRLRSKLTNPRTRYLVADGDLETIFDGWISGEDEDELFVRLGYVQRSGRHPSVEDWLAGISQSQSWHEEFDKFMEFLQGTVMGFLPWILRSCGALQNFASVTALTADWARAADMLETGTNSAWAAAAVRDGAPASRSTLVLVGQQWPADLLTAEDPLALPDDPAARQRLLGNLDRSAAYMSETSSSAADEIVEMREWLLSRPSRRG